MLSVEDRLALTDLVHRYAFLVDARRYDEVGLLFAPDTVLVAPDPPADLGPVRELRGRDAIVTELGRLDGFALTFHALVGQVVEAVDADHARGHVACVAHHVPTGGRDAQDLVWHLRYADDYVRSDDGWLLARREITIAMIDSRSVARARG